MAGVKFQDFLLTFNVVLIAFWHYLASVWYRFWRDWIFCDARCSKLTHDV